jgi:hypothetical protein
VSDCVDLGFHGLFKPEDRLYRWVHPEDISDGIVLPAHSPTAQWRTGLSCDWSVLARPEDTARRKGGSLPAHVISIRIRQCLDLGLDVHHCPVLGARDPNDNPAHCLLFPGDRGKTAIREMRDRFLEQATLMYVAPGILRRLSSLVHLVRRGRRAQALRLIEDAVLRSGGPDNRR